MRNKIFITIICIVFLSSFAFGEEETMKTTNNSTWGENTSVFNSGFENQEAVSDTKLKKVIDKCIL